MEEYRRKAGWPFYAVIGGLALLIALPFLYVIGYVTLPWCTNYDDFCTYRAYSSKWQAQLFEPAARIEQILTQRQTAVMHEPSDQ